MGKICDLCDTPLKLNKPKIILVLLEEKPDGDKAKYTSYESIVSNKKEICETCRDIIQRIFLQRKTALNHILKEIEDIWNLDTK